MVKKCLRCKYENQDDAHFCIKCRRPLPYPLEGARLGTRVRGNQTQPVVLTAEDRRQHLYIVGGTGVGKSTFMLNLIDYDLNKGHGVAIIDPKSGLVDHALTLIPPSRRSQAILINPADNNCSVGLNLLEAVPKEYRGLAAAELVSILRRLFDSWGAQLERYLFYAALTLLEVPGATLAEMPPLFLSPSFRECALQSVTDPMVKEFWEFEFGDKKSGHSGTVAALLNRVQPFLADPRVLHIVGQKSTFEVRQVMDAGGIILADLSKGKIGSHASQLLGQMLVSKIQLAAMARANIPETQRRDFYLYVDEVQNFTTSAFQLILSEARAFGLSLVVANQYTGQLDQGVRDAIFGNVGSMVVFRVGHQDAAVISRQMPPLHAEDFVSLDNYKALAKISVNGRPSSPFRLDTYPPPINTEALPPDVVRQSARELYTRPRSIIEKEIRNRRTLHKRNLEFPSLAQQVQFEDIEEMHPSEE